jgi:hypothetical protein
MPVGRVGPDERGHDVNALLVCDSLWGAVGSVSVGQHIDDADDVSLAEALIGKSVTLAEPVKLVAGHLRLGVPGLGHCSKRQRVQSAAARATTVRVKFLLLGKWEHGVPSRARHVTSG